MKLQAENLAAPAPGYETKDASVKGTAWTLVGVAVLIAALLGGAFWLLTVLADGREVGKTTGRTSAPPPFGPRPPGVLLQTDPARDYTRWSGQQRAELERYALTKSGGARIPIERAMEIVAQRGLSAARAEMTQEDDE